jgi:hypothetical protein
MGASPMRLRRRLAPPFLAAADHRGPSNPREAHAGSLEVHMNEAAFLKLPPGGLGAGPEQRVRLRDRRQHRAALLADARLGGRADAHRAGCSRSVRRVQAGVSP